MMNWIKTVFLLLFLVWGMGRIKASVFVYCSEASPSAFNPQITTDGASSNAAAHTIYDQLVGFKLGSTEVVPGLAESWQISKDGLKYTFKLRKGVKFHTTKYFAPKRDFNADDVIFSINRQRLKDHPYHNVGGGSYEFFQAMDMANAIKDVKKIDDYTVEIILKRPEAPFLANLAMGFMSILSKEYADYLAGTKGKDKADIDHLPIGTGPFAFKKYQKDTLIRYTAHKNYFKGGPKIKKLVYAITPNPSVRYQKLKAGECHFANEPAPTDLLAMKKNSSLKVLTDSGLNVGYLALNTEKGPFKDVRVRKAINHALNKKSYIKAIYLGNAIPAKNPIPPTIWSYNNKTSEYSYNPKLARKLLKQAGFPKGFKTTLWWLPVSRPYNPNGKKMAEMMIKDLKDVGIEAEPVSFEWGKYLAEAKKGKYGMIQGGWTGDNGDPDNFLNYLLGCAGKRAGANYARWCHKLCKDPKSKKCKTKGFEEYIQLAKITSDLNARIELYKKAQRVFNKHVPWVPLVHSKVSKAMNAKVRGYVMDPLGHDKFYHVSLEN